MGSTGNQHTYSAGDAREDDSEVSIVDYQHPVTMDRAGRQQPGNRAAPRKIVITVSFSDLLGYPVLRISQCISVLRFQKSLADLQAGSDGIYRSLLLFPNMLSLTSTGGLSFTKNLVTSVWHRHGIAGFFRGFPEFVTYKLTRDVMNFLVPTYIAPKLELSANHLYKGFTSFEYGCLTHLKTKYRDRFKGLADEDNKLMFWENKSVKRFIKRNIGFNPHEFLVKALVELLTYPLLTISSKMMIYDGTEQLNGLSLLGGTITHDGLSYLYNGFTWQLVALILQQLEKQHDSLRRQMSFTMDDISTPLDQTLPVLLTLANMICQQISLVHRCGSNMDGFCNKETSMGILSKFSWVNISSQLLLTVCLMHLKDKVL